MKKKRYITGLIFLWLLFSAVTLLLLARFALNYGKVRITLDYTSYKKETISIYWSDMFAWDSEKYIQKKASEGRHEYSFTIRHADSLCFLRIDPDEECDSAIIHSICVNGISCPLYLSAFDTCRHRESDLVQKKNGTALYKEKGSNDPQVIIKIDPRCRKIIYEWEFSDLILIAVTFLVDIFLLICAYRRKLFLKLIGEPRFFFVVIFLVLISAHWENYVLDFYPVPVNMEKRELEKFPKWEKLYSSSDTFFTACSQYCYDHFRFRNELIKDRSAMYLGLFGESSIPSKVVMGEEGMYFPSFAWLTDDFTGKISYPQQFLDSVITKTKEKHDMLSRQGIAFYIVVPPCKQMIYHDLMPAYYRLQQKKPSMQDQIMDAMKKAGIDYFISLTEPLTDVRNKEPGRLLYYLNDTHWNEYGAFRAYQSLMNFLHQKDSCYGKPLTEKDITIDTTSDTYGDLAECLLLNKISRRTTLKIFPFCSDSVPSEIVAEKNRKKDTYIFNNPGGSGKVLFYRDSYMVSWQPFFTHHFRQSIFIWDYNMDMNEIMRYDPDVVILELGEMYITNLNKPIIPYNDKGR